MNRDVPPLGTGERLRLYLDSLGLQASWNPQRMQNLGLLATLVGWLRRQPRDVDRDRLFCRRYYEFFNTNPYLANYLVGSLVRLESERQAGAELPPDLARMVRDSLARSLASIGDQLFWLGLRPALVMGMCLLGLYGRALEVLGLVAVFTAAQLALRWRALGRGYRLGMEVVEDLADPRWHKAIAVATRAGMVLTGAVAASYMGLLTDMVGQGGGSLLLAGAAVGMGLPLACRRRPPGEILVLVGLGLAVALSFAIPPVGG